MGKEQLVFDMLYIAADNVSSAIDNEGWLWPRSIYLVNKTTRALSPIQLGSANVIRFLD